MLTGPAEGADPFDAHAVSYGEAWERDAVARVLREVVHARLSAVLAPASRVLDAGCGTGIDAAWLAAQGHEVVAVDRSAGMVAAARARGVPARQLAVEELDALISAGGISAGEPPFDAVLLDFGVANVAALRAARGPLSRVLRPGGRLFVVTMPRVHPTWLLSHLARGRPRAALSRLRPVVEVPVEEGTVRTRYLGARALARELGPAFALRDRAGLGFLLPPPGGRARGLSILARIEAPLRRLPLLRDLGDHVLCELERLPDAPWDPPSRPGRLARRRAAARARRTGRVEALHTLVLHLTDGCNSRCVACDFRGPAGGEALDLAAAARLCREARELGAVEVLLTGGEPLLRPDLPEILAAARAADLRPILLTNGLLLRRHAAVVARHAHEVVLSLDGHDAETYRAARGVDGLGAVRAGVAALHALAPDLPVRARVTVTAANAAALPGIAQAAADLGCASVSFLAADLSPGDAFGRGGAAATPALVPDPDTLARTLAALRETHGDFVVDSPFARDRLVSKYAADLGRQAHRPPPCDAPWTSVVVRPDLSLRPCFFIAGEGDGAHARDHLSAGLHRMGRQLAAHRVEDDPRCARCVCWAKLG